jgi:hypothetical protein
LDEPLSEVRYRETSAVVNYRAAIEGLTVQRDLLRADPRFEACRSWVDGMTQRIERITRRSRLHPGEVDEHAVRAIFFPPPLWKQLRRRVGSAVRRLRSRDTAIWRL